MNEIDMIDDDTISGESAAVDRWIEESERMRKAVPFPRQPVQPLTVTEHGTTRFQENKIVRYMLDLCTEKGIFDLNDIGRLGCEGFFNQADQEQFAQLIGYSLSGFGELNYVSDHTYDRAENSESYRIIQRARNGEPEVPEELSCAGLIEGEFPIEGPTRPVPFY